MPKRELLFSLSKKDFEIQTFKAGGKGGQHQNKTNSGVRVIHHASGARGESRTERHQYLNKRLAFERLAASPKFKLWLSKAVMESTTGKTIDQRVDELMSPENIEIEVVDTNGKWRKETDHETPTTKNLH
jgi:protein subunit release factor B